MDEHDTILRFPPQLRMAAFAEEMPEPIGSDPTLVDYDGRVYRLADLMGRLPSAKLTEVEAAGPRIGQEAWGVVVRSCPALAGEIVARCSSCR